MRTLPRILETPEINIKNFLNGSENNNQNKSTLEQFIKVGSGLPSKGSSKSFYFNLKEQKEEDL